MVRFEQKIVNGTVILCDDSGPSISDLPDELRCHLSSDKLKDMGEEVDKMARKAIPDGSAKRQHCRRC